MTWRVLPAKVQTVSEERSSFADWKQVLSYPNIRVLTLLMLCCLVCLVTTSTFTPSFLLDHLHLGSSAMTIIVAAIGLGAAAGALFLPWSPTRSGANP